MNGKKNKINVNTNTNNNYTLTTLYEYLVKESTNESLDWYGNNDYTHDFLCRHFIIQENDISQETYTKCLKPPLKYQFDAAAAISSSSLAHNSFDYIIDLDFHLETINYIIVVLKKLQYSNNLLVYNYSYLINDTQWFKLHQFIGTLRFQKLLFNFKMFEYLKQNVFIQLSGNKKIDNNFNSIYINPYTNSNDSSNMKIFTPNYYLFKMFKNTKKTILNIIPNDNLKEICVSILNSNNDTAYGIGIFKKIWTEIRQNHKKIFYMNIYNSICVGQNVVDINVVLKFLIVVIEKLFPLELWGNKHNKSLVIKNINKLLKMDINKTISIKILLIGIQTKDIKWSIDNNNTNTLYIKFFEWFYLKFFPNLVKTFFYVTNTSSKIAQVCFYRQDTFQKIISKQCSKYCKEYLIENTTCYTSKNNGIMVHDKKIIHTKLRVVPKNLDSINDNLRFVAVPNPLIQFETEMKFKWFVEDYILPIRKILSDIRLNYLALNDTFPKISNVFEIPILIKIFKNSLKYNSGKNDLYFIKFDIKSCYDSIPIEKIISLLGNWLDTINVLNDEWIIHKNSISLINPELSMKQVIRKEFIINDSKPYEFNKNLETIKINQRHNEIMKFSKEDIMYVVKKELLETCIEINGKCYYRGKGVFQGMYLSQIIVDLLYDEMIRTHPIFHTDDTHGNEKTKSTIIRLADDFLVLSNSYTHIQDIAQQCSVGFADYNAYINVEKLQYSLHENPLQNLQSITFVGLTINLQNLEITKKESTFTDINYSFEPSLKTVYKKLLNLLEVRLKYNLLNIQLNSNETIIEHITLIISNLMRSFINFIKESSPKTISLSSTTDLKNFLKFLHNCLKSIKYHMWKTNSYLFDKSNPKICKKQRLKKFKSLEFRYSALNKHLQYLITKTMVNNLQKHNMHARLPNLINLLKE